MKMRNSIRKLVAGATALACPLCLLLLLVQCGGETDDDLLTSDLNAIMQEFEAQEAHDATDAPHALVAPKAELPQTEGLPGIRQAGSSELEAAGLRTNAMMVEGGGAGLESGDLIAFVNEEPAASLDAFSRLVEEAGSGTVSLLIYRKGIPRRFDAQAPALLAAMGRKPEKHADPVVDEAETESGMNPPEEIATGEDGPPEDEFTRMLGQVIIETAEGETSEIEVTEYGGIEEPSGYEGDDPAATAEELQALIEQLRHPESVERMQAAMEIAMYGSAAVVAIPALLEATEDSESSVRMAAAIGIGGIGAEPETAQAVPALIRMLEDPSAVVRAEAARSLSDVWLDESNMGRAVSALEKALQDQDDRVREAAADSLDAQGY